MIRMALAQDGRLGATQNRGRPSVYLHHWALRNISQNPAWAEQFREGLHARGGSLAISLQNFVEFSQLTDRSQIATAEQFIDSLLPNIYFQDISYSAVIRAEKDQLQELRGEKERSRPPGNVDSDHVMFDCFLKRARTFGTTISVRGSLAELAEHLQFYKAEMAEAARVMIAKAEGEYYPVFAQKPKKEINAILKGSPSWTESWFVATFEYLYKRREQLDVNDVSDIIHTIVPVTHCHYVLLDSDTWHMVGVIRQRFEKLRGEKVPPIAKAYKPGDVEQFLADLATGPTATPAPEANIRPQGPMSLWQRAKI